MSTHKPRHSIVILTYNKPELITARVQEIFDLYGQRTDIELFLFDNGSTDPEHALAWLEIRSGMEGFLMPRSMGRIEENVGFGLGFNAAVDASSGEIVHLLSNDVQVTGDFITPVETCLLTSPGAVIGERLIIKSGWNEFGDNPPINYLGGHYLAMRRETWDDIGGFDERYYPYDYEDIDLCLTASRKGHVMIVPRLPLNHLVAGTIGYNPKRYENTVLQRKRFAEKWRLENIPEQP